MGDYTIQHTTPSYQIPILEELFEELKKNKTLIIDTLALAYLKDGQYDKATHFIDDCFGERMIDENFKMQMHTKLKNIQIDKESEENYKKSFSFLSAEECPIFRSIIMFMIGLD